MSVCDLLSVVRVMVNYMTSWLVPIVIIVTEMLFVVYSGFAQLCTVLYVIFYYVCSTESLCISSLCQCHCLNLFDIKFCLFLSQWRTLSFVDEPLWWWSTLLLLLSLERTNKTFYDLQIWWKLPVCETERGSAVWTLVDRECCYVKKGDFDGQRVVSKPENQSEFVSHHSLISILSYSNDLCLNFWMHQRGG